MSASQCRSQLDRKRDQRREAERKAAEYRAKESKKRAEADKARAGAAATRSEATARSKLREADRKLKEAEAAGKEASRWSSKAAQRANEEATAGRRLARAIASEDAAEERARKRAQQRSDRAAEAQRRELEGRVDDAERAVADLARTLPAPKAEKLRVLVLGASSDGELRVGREAKRIRVAVESALHRDYIDLDVRPAATAGDLLDGITKSRPHVVHFSGHSDTATLEFERDLDEPQQIGHVVSAAAFAKAISATDDPPLLVLLNSCNSAAQLPGLVPEVVPFAIGMSDEIDDGDAINYAAQFYASIANGQSIWSSHLAGQAALELAGLSGAELPTLLSADDVDPAGTILVKGPSDT